jgi:hypothetical protein
LIRESLLNSGVVLTTAEFSYAGVYNESMVLPAPAAGKATRIVALLLGREDTISVISRVIIDDGLGNIFGRIMIKGGEPTSLFPTWFEGLADVPVRVTVAGDSTGTWYLNAWSKEV